MLSQRAREAYGGIEASALNLNVVEASRANVARLKALLRPRSSDEHLFFRRFIHLPFILEHRSHSWAAIKGQTKESPGDRNWKGKILSLLELAKLFAIRPRKYTRVKDATKRKWLVPGTEIEPANPEIGENFHFTKINGKPIAEVQLSDISSFSVIQTMLGDLAVKINTGETDFRDFGNIDFCFFKWTLAGQVSLELGGGGIAAAKPKHFVDHLLYSEGFITFDDWISYHSDQTFQKNLNTVWDGFGQNGQMSVRFSRSNKSKIYTYRNQTLVKKIPDEVFFGGDIFAGSALTVTEHLRAIDPGGGFIRHALQNDFNGLVWRFVSTVWQLIEAKLPGTMNYYDYKISKAQATGREPFTDSRKHEGGSWARR